VILPDVNLLVYAYRREAPDHDRHAAWLADLVGGADDLALVDHVLVGFIRIVTNPRIVATPAPTADALAFVEVLRTARRARSLPPTGATWAQFAQLAALDAQVRGNLVPDAWLAAIALSHGCRLATADRGFARFPGLDWFIPVP
jgi:toxin-antitoxin system PIN domain toxin